MSEITETQGLRNQISMFNGYAVMDNFMNGLNVDKLCLNPIEELQNWVIGFISRLNCNKDHGFPTLHNALLITLNDQSTANILISCIEPIYHTIQTKYNFQLPLKAPTLSINDSLIEIHNVIKNTSDSTGYLQKIIFMKDGEIVISMYGTTRGDLIVNTIDELAAVLDNERCNLPQLNEKK
jgi:hypothetical protein